MKSPHSIGLLGIAWLIITIMAVATSTGPGKTILTITAIVYGYVYGWVVRDVESD